MESSGTIQNKLNNKVDTTPVTVTSYIMLRKKQMIENNSNNSILYLDKGNNNKIAYTLKNEREFFLKENVDVNIKKLRSKLSDDNTDTSIKNKQLKNCVKGKNNTLESLDLRTGNDDNSHIKFIKEKEDLFSAMINKENNIITINNNIVKKEDPIITKIGEIKENILKLKASNLIYNVDPNRIEEKDEVYTSQNNNMENEKININDNIPKCNQKKVSRKSLLQIFQKIMNKEEKEKKSEKNLMNMKKITFRKSETISRHKFYKHPSLFGNKEDNRVTVDPLGDNYFNTTGNCELVCFICDLQILKDKTFKFNTCNHIFCEKCGKAFYEEKIEQGEKHIKCPSFKCPSIIEEKIVESLVSKMHFRQYKKLSNNQKESLNKITIPSGGSSKSNVNPLQKNNTVYIKQDYFKMYSQKHVLDITSQDTYFGFNRARDYFCIKCFEPALFAKMGRNYIKCLNCTYFTCKYCMKEFGSDHFELTSNNYCKIYFRKKSSKVEESNGLKCFKILLNSVIIYLISYFFFIFGTVFLLNSHITSLLENIYRSSCVFGYILYIIIWILCGAILILFFWLIIPFFPVLIAIFQ